MARRISSAEFVVSAVGPRDFPTDGRPEIALVGRSNVGKSTLINALAGRDVARTSSTPGKTRQVNVYRITAAGGPSFYLADLPGYGHAGGGETARQEFTSLTALYFASRTGKAAPLAGRPAASASPLCAVVLAIDGRHPGMASDIEACRWLDALGLPFLLVATKVDKLSQADRSRLKPACLLAFGQPPLAVSALEDEGLDRLWQQMRDWLAR